MQKLNGNVVTAALEAEARIEQIRHAPLPQQGDGFLERCDDCLSANAARPVEMPGRRLNPRCCRGIAPDRPHKQTGADRLFQCAAVRAANAVTATAICAVRASTRERHLTGRPARYAPNRAGTERAQLLHFDRLE